MHRIRAISFKTVLAVPDGVAPAVLAVVLGAFLVFGVGFAQPMAIHNAAHNVRHAFAFPCH